MPELHREYVGRLQAGEALRNDDVPAVRAAAPGPR